MNTFKGVFTLTYLKVYILQTLSRMYINNMGIGETDHDQGRRGKGGIKIPAQGMAWDQQEKGIQATRGNGRKRKRITMPISRISLTGPPLAYSCRKVEVTSSVKFGTEIDKEEEQEYQGSPNH